MSHTRRASDKGNQKTTTPLLRDKTFYIDEKDVSKAKLRRLEKALTVLGAKVDKFFTKEILYLITDHGQEEDYKLSKSKVGDEGDVSTPSPFAFTPGSGIGTPPESTNASTKSKPATSRGSAILAKIRGSNSQGTPSNISVSEQLVRNARQWNINMLKVDTALNSAEKKASQLGLNRRNVSTDRAERAQRAREKQLRAPYIKIEHSGTHRPVYRQLATGDVPVLNTQAMHCPFETAGTTGARPDTLNLADISDPQADKTLDTSKNLADKPNKGKSPIVRGKVKAIQKKTSNNLINNNNNHNHEMKKKKLSFCMLCKVRYDDLEQHLRSDQHQEFSRNDDNYSAVDKLINTNASMRRFLDDIMTYHRVYQQEGLQQNISNKVMSDPTATEDTGQSQPAVTPDLIHHSVSVSTCSEGGDNHRQLVIEENGEQQVVPQPEQHIDIQIESCTNAENVEMKPNLTSVEVKPKIINDTNARSPKKTSSPIKQSKASPVKPNLATIEAKHLNQNMNNSNDQPVIPYDLESDMSPSEIVKLRKRGKKASIDSLKRIVSPEKSNKKSPARRSPRKAPVKQSKPTVKAASPQKKKSMTPADKSVNDEEMAKVKAHWNLLSNKNTCDSQESHGLPLDVSYGVLDEDQIKNLAGQKTSIGNIDDDDLSLVQSIHGLLTDNNFSKDIDDGDDPLLLCDSYISQQVSNSQDTQRNSMMKPATPKKSPRLSLGARDLPDEHFSPQKQRLSLSLEKEERSSARTPDKQRKRIPKLNFDQALRDDPVFSPTENKENHLTPPSPAMEDSQETQSTHSVDVESDIDHSSYVYDKTTDTASEGGTSKSPRKSLMSPNSQTEEKSIALRPLTASTPANDLLSKPTFSVVSSTPTSISIKKSLFSSNDGSKETDNAGEMNQKETSSKLVTSQARAQQHPVINRQRSVHFEQQNSSVEYVDCFGFDEGWSPVVKTIGSPTKDNACVYRFTATPNNKTRRGSCKSSAARLSKQDFERQSSLLSFGSASQCDVEDDVFSSPPRLPDTRTPGSTANDTTGQASSQLENTQSSTGNYDSLNRPKHFTINPTSDLTVYIKRKKKSSSSPSSPSSPPRRRKVQNKITESPSGDFSGWSNADLSAPGFRMNSRSRRALRKDREFSSTHQQPRRSPRKLGQTVNSHGKRLMSTSPEYTPTKRLRVELHMITLPVSPWHQEGDQPYTVKLGENNSLAPLEQCRRSPRKSKQVYSKRGTPHVCKVRERLRLLEKDWSICSSDTSNDNIPDPTVCEKVPVFSPVKRSNYQHVNHSSPVKRNYLKKKYCYPVGTRSLRSSASSPQCTPPHACPVNT